jgi:hypothetical protein
MSDTTTTGAEAAPEPVPAAADDAAAYGRVIHPVQDIKPVPAVLAAICEIMNAIDAIGKDKRSDHGGFKFRGIDDVMNVVAPLLRAHCVFITPKLVASSHNRYTSNGGGGLMNTVVEVEYVFTSAADGSTHTVGPIPGEGMDAGDKSTAKAMSVAMRTMLLQVFAIPTEDRDPDHDVYEVAPPGRDATATNRAPRASGAKPNRRASAAEVDPWADDNPERVDYYRGAIEASGNNDSLRLVWDEIATECKSGTLSAKDGQFLHTLTTRRIEAIKAQEAAAAAADPEADFHTA